METVTENTATESSLTESNVVEETGETKEEIVESSESDVLKAVANQPVSESIGEMKVSSELALLEPRMERLNVDRNPLKVERQKQALSKEKKIDPPKKLLKRDQFLRKKTDGDSSDGKLSNHDSSDANQLPSSLKNYLFPLASRRPPVDQTGALSSLPRISVGPSSSVFYELNDYNWPYESYMRRWARGLLYNWRIDPPLDYIRGQVPDGGNVFVAVTLDLKGKVTTYGVTKVEGATTEMINSVLNAIVGTTNLPPLPPDFKEPELKVQFKFIYPSIYRLSR